MRKLIEDLYLADFAPVSPGADEAVERFSRELDFKVIEVASGTEKNGWQVPNSWHCTKGEIRKNGKLIYDGRKHPLGVVGYSPPFSGKVTAEDLREHLFFVKERPRDLVFHCTHFFRPLERDWGFCVPKELYDSLSHGEYDITIETVEKPGTMKILEYTLPGDSDETIVLHAHNCHPGQANDDLSGCAVGIEFMKRLRQKPKRRFTYTLIVSAELLGTFYWLDRLSDERIRKLKSAIMIKSVGNKADLKLQHSYPGNADIDRAARNVMRELNPGFVSGDFRRVYGNDETLFEAPGYEVPTVSLTRYPFPEYHSSSDTPSIIDDTRLEETVEVLAKISFALENNFVMKRNFKGLLALSHPRYGLYQPFWNPAAKEGPSAVAQNEMHYLMIYMFRDFDGKRTILEVAERHRLPFRQVFDYLSKLRGTGAISFEIRNS